MKVILELAGLDEIMPSIDGEEATVKEQHVHGLYEPADERIENAGKFRFLNRSWIEKSLIS